MISSQETALCQRRVVKELAEIINNPITNVRVACDRNDNLNWHCLIYGLTEVGFVNGEYLFNIKLSARYPFEPPDFTFLTPNGRFEVNKKLCFSNSGYHKEEWSPIWTIKTIILGFLSFFLEKTSSGIGHLTTTPEMKTDFANKSIAYNRQNFPVVMALFN
jgi:ubiquitin-protein ligase